MKKKVEFVDKSHVMKCWACKDLSKKVRKKCKVCNGTCKFKEDFFHLIYTNENGEKIGFGVDGIK